MAQHEVAPNTHFVFEHKVFKIDGCYFAPVGDAPALCMRLGEIDVSVSFPQLRSEFEIPKESDDGQMLAMVEEALRFIRKIRPNDSIPTELIDGTASWSVDPRHLEIAQARLTVQLTNWLTGDDVVVLDQASLMALLADEKTKEMVQRGFEEISEKLGYGRHRKHEVADKVDQFAQEMSYIEALKERVHLVARIRAKLNKLAGYHRQDPMLTEELMRMDVLIQNPLKRMADPIEDLYGQTSEIMTVLRQFPKLVTYVRQVRDTLRAELIDWEEIIALWQSQPADASSEALALARRTYRFLAQNYQQSQHWASAG